jgi:hypothetical protein
VGTFLFYKEAKMNNFFDKLKGPFGWSIGSLLILAIFLFLTISAVIAPLFMKTSERSTQNRIVVLLEQYEENNLTDIARFNGRSAFFKPIRIARPTPPPAPRKDVEELPPPAPPEQLGPPPAPASYTGPPLIAIIGEEAWFRSGGSSSPVIRLHIGEESNGLKLIRTHAPTLVTVEHRRGTYEIPLFDADESFFREEPLPSSTNDFFKEVEG